MKRIIYLLLLYSASLMAQESKTQYPAPVSFTAAQDHQNMMDQLGIQRLRPGANGNEKAPDHANYDESKANPFPNLRSSALV